MKSMAGYSVLLNGVFIEWCLKIQKMFTLSVTESEYSKITDLCCEILFICVVLFFMGVVVKYSIIVHVDNVGDIVLSDNTLVFQQKNHIDVCHHFRRDFVEDGTVKINLFIQKKILQICLLRT